MSTQVGESVRRFYNTTPFPDYELDRFNTKEDLKASANAFARIIDRSIPEEASVLDAGTGTGQLSAFLSLRRKHVLGIDFSDSSLNKAKALKQKLGLNTWHLKKIDLLNSEQIDSIDMKFDYVLCLGVLHHTGQPYEGFKNIIRLLKPRGYIAVGLYNKYGRMPLKIRKFLINNIFKDNQKLKNNFMKMQLGSGMQDKEKLRGWWNDQYLHPHETVHTIWEVLRWFKKNDISFLQTVPSSVPFSEQKVDFAGDYLEGLWVKQLHPFFPIGVMKQIAWIWETNHEGGYWVTFGQKNSKTSP